MKNKALLFHAFSLALFLVGCGFFYIVGGGSNTEIVQEKQTADINIIPDPLESESGTHEKSKMELFEEYQQEQQRKEAEEKAQQDFNSLSFFTGSSSSYTEEDTIASEQQEAALSKEEEIELLNKIGNEKKETLATARKSVSNTSANADISFEEKEKKESIEEKIQRQKKEQMYAKKKRIAEKTGIDITEPSEVPQQIASAPKTEDKNQTPTTQKKNKGFRTMGAEATSGDNSSIRAVIHGEQKNITTASQVKLRLLDNVKVNPNLTIPKNTMVYAKASFSSNRIHLNIESIAYNNNVYPFNAQIYDLDGFEGLYVPDNVVSDAGKETSSNTVSGTSIGITPSQRALSNVITNTTSAIKNATSNKIRETKVTLPANYKLIIKKKSKTI